jgi:hypothetical protein
MIIRVTSPQKPSEQLALAPILNSVASAMAASLPSTCQRGIAGSTLRPPSWVMDAEREAIRLAGSAHMVITARK